MRRPHGFTLVEMVVAITVAAIVVSYAGLMITAPLNMFETQARRAEMQGSATDAWPAMRNDLRVALPNSVRVRRNGSYVALELLAAVDWVRYQAPPAAPFTTSGTFRGITVPFSSTSHFLSVNNLGTGVAGGDAYALSGSITPAGSNISIVAGAIAGEQRVTVTPAPVFTANSPRRRAYLVAGPVTYLCDEAAGTLRRYAGYSIAASQSSRDTPGELLGAGAGATQLAGHISHCDFAVSPGSSSATQVATIRMASTRNGETLSLTQQARLENLP
jgi:MSHA biogenesis protein MshO